MDPLRILVLHPDHSDPETPYASLSPNQVPEFYLDPKHKVEKIFLKKASAIREVLKVADKYDVFVNLCDGAADETVAGIDVIRALERKNCAYTGADVDFYDPSRVAMKMACASVGVQFPRYELCLSVEELQESLTRLDLRFPVLCKHFSSYNSLGMTKGSRVTNLADLKAESERFCSEYTGVLMEEFIEGPEFTVLVASNADQPSEPIVYTPIECRFPPGETFKHYDLKWVNYEGLEWEKVADPVLAERLRTLSRKVFLAMGGRGYGRLDIRMDAATGDLYVLEINPNCGIFYPEGSWGSSDFILGQDPTHNHRQFLDNQIKFAIQERTRRLPLVKIKPLPRTRNILGAFGMFAERALSAGSVIQALEERPVHLVSRRRTSEWQSPKKDWVGDYCWSLNDGTYAMWDPVPDNWRPINHSCEPTAWLVGLDMVARRDLARGEEVTLDYSTFMSELEPFDCLCRAPTCRGHITGLDYLRPELVRAYAGHFTAHIEAKQRAAGLTAEA